MGVSYMVAAHVRIDLRRRHAGVAEHGLHAAQIGSASQQVSRKRMPKLVRVNAAAQANAARIAADDFPETLACERAPAR